MSGFQIGLATAAVLSLAGAVAADAFIAKGFGSQAARRAMTVARIERCEIRERQR
jgi:hypothetical protein